MYVHLMDDNESSVASRYYFIYFIINLLSFVIIILGSKSSQQCLLYLWTINGRLVKQIKSDVQILSLCYTSAPEGVYINVIITGMANGTIR